MNSLTDITDVANNIATDGIATVPHEQLRAIATSAVRHGASPVLANVVADPSQPEVARTRAFGRITLAFLTTVHPFSQAA